jgi:hypothetical protein
VAVERAGTEEEPEMSFVSSDSNLKTPHLRRTWRNDDGSNHATVELSPGATLYFDSPADARAVAAACIEAAEALDRLAAEGA